jgi:hypothetical protein
MQISRHTPTNRISCSRLFPQQPCRKQFSLARARIERWRQHGSAFGDEREQSSTTNYCYKEENVFRTRRHKRVSKSSQNTFTGDNQGNEDFLPIILRTSSLSLFSSVSLFILIDAGKNDGVRPWCIGIPARRHPRRRRAADRPSDRESKCRVHKTASPEAFSGLAHD